ncbi:hit family protein 1-like [Teratosphaeria destructans]|uniref:Hit family protein 1-like n=1 Tax=Teratosphaeria destructans TaxID=418781 RepID=A0A9W7VZT5_9PEZI|nr:hit family protein 1-like [Teratosphaeria destructans]
MSSTSDPYPESCPFCTNASAYPPFPTSPIPISPDRTKVSPNCWLLLSTPHVLAFLDILPISPGHILLCPRKHYAKLSDLHAPLPTPSPTWVEHQDLLDRRKTSEELGRWLPILSRALCQATGVEDWNVVQNNGVRAAQVVGHVHFHLIPRYQEGRGRGRGEVELRSWRMFGKGVREDLDEEEGDVVAERVREALRVEIGDGEGGRGRAKL